MRISTPIVVLAITAGMVAAAAWLAPPVAAPSQMPMKSPASSSSTQSGEK